MFKTLFKLMIICTSLLINGCGGDDDNISTENEEITLQRNADRQDSE